MGKARQGDNHRHFEYITLFFTVHIVPPPLLKKVCDVSGAKVFKSMKKDAKVFIIDNCGHAISVEQPKRCALLIEELVSQDH